MALLTLGTNATTSLSAVVWNPGMVQADFAAFDALIGTSKKGSTANPIPAVAPFKLDQAGTLFFAGRDGHIQLLPGDYLALDTTTGWPIVLSANAIALGPYTHS